MHGRVPIIDIGAWYRGDMAARDALAREVDAACRDLGFLVVAGHRVDSALIWDLHRVAYAFFDLPAEEKAEIAYGRRSANLGYGAFQSDKLSYSYDGDADPGAMAPDLKENFAMGPFGYPDQPYYTGPEGRQYFQPNVWPRRPDDMQETFEAYYLALEDLAGDIMRIFARALRLEDDFFDDKIDRHTTHLNVQHYPAQHTPPVPGQLRGGAHTDFGSLTILHTGERPAGLQVQDRDGSWHDVAVPDGAFVINIGDLMEVWTNGVWRSTMHRVVNPPGETQARLRRQSIPFFHQPNYDAAIECLPTCTGPDNPPRYAPTTSGAHFLEKIGRLRHVRLGADAAE